MCSSVPLFVNMLNADACEENGKQCWNYTVL